MCDEPKRIPWFVVAKRTRVVNWILDDRINKVQAVYCQWVKLVVTPAEAELITQPLIDRCEEPSTREAERRLARLLWVLCVLLHRVQLAVAGDRRGRPPYESGGMRCVVNSTRELEERSCKLLE